MKKTLLAFMLLVVCKIVSAQESGIGLKAGVNFANMNLNSGSHIDTKPKTGIHFGLFYNFVINEKLTLRPELLYSMMGCKYKPNTDAGLNLNYITVPMVVKYKLTDLFSFNVGPQIGFLTKAEFDASGDKIALKDDFQAADIGAMLGMEVDLSGIGFGARYYWGLIDIQIGSTYEDVRNRNFQLYAFYTLKK